MTRPERSKRVALVSCRVRCEIVKLLLSSIVEGDWARRSIDDPFFFAWSLPPLIQALSGPLSARMSLD